MTSRRYSLRPEMDNSKEIYRDNFRKRGVKHLRQYAAPKFKLLSRELVSQVEVQIVTWKLSSRFYKLADEFYGDPTLWWVIAFFNRKPTDFHAKLGDTIFIPNQWELVYNAVVEGRV